MFKSMCLGCRQLLVLKDFEIATVQGASLRHNELFCQGLKTKKKLTNDIDNLIGLQKSIKREIEHELNFENVAD